MRKKIQNSIPFLIFLISSVFGALLFLSACKKPVAHAAKDHEMVLLIEKTALRSAPSQDAEERATLKPNDTLYLTGNLSQSTSIMNYNDILYNDPWVEVISKKKTRGWVYAAHLHFHDKINQPIYQKIIKNRLSYFTNAPLAKKIETYQQSYAAAKTSKDFHALWELGDVLKPQIQKCFSDKIAYTGEEDVFPDFDWFEIFLPGYISLVSGHQCYLFRDFTSLSQKALSTSGTEDDDLIRVCESIYALDSIEYFDPGWNIEDETGGLHSLLGDGIHYNIAVKIDTALYQSNLFQDQLYQFKKVWIQDIAGKNISYWNDSPKIMKEIRKILDKKFRMLNDSDASTLETRINMFKDPKKNNIIVNQRSGMNEELGINVNKE